MIYKENDEFVTVICPVCEDLEEETRQLREETRVIREEIRRQDQEIIFDDKSI